MGGRVLYLILQYVSKFTAVSRGSNAIARLLYVLIVFFNFSSILLLWQLNEYLLLAIATMYTVSGKKGNSFLCITSTNVHTVS